jgi:hypothetical protein
LHAASCGFGGNLIYTFSEDEVKYFLQLLESIGAIKHDKKHDIHQDSVTSSPVNWSFNGDWTG